MSLEYSESVDIAPGLAPEPGRRVGHGVGAGHFGELFQGQVLDDAGTLRRCLVTLPYRQLQSRATWQPGGEGVRVRPAHKTKAQRTTELTLAWFERTELGGELIVESNIKEGKGNGSSSADCVAAARAVADSLGQPLPERELARIVVAAELASDSVMFDRAVLFAHRDGLVLEDYGSRLPPLEVIGLDAQPESVVDTLGYPLADYSRSELGVFRLLQEALSQAIRSSDPRLLGEVATASALVNQRFLRNPCFDDLSRLASSADALGIAVAHSGTVGAVLLDPRDPACERKAALVMNHFAARASGHIVRFRAG